MAYGGAALGFRRGLDSLLRSCKRPQQDVTKKTERDEIGKGGETGFTRILIDSTFKHQNRPKSQEEQSRVIGAVKLS